MILLVNVRLARKIIHKHPTLLCSTFNDEA